jgi:feruloyl-CoA synthase
MGGGAPGPGRVGGSEPLRYRPVSLGGSTHASVEALADGSLLLRSTEALGAYPIKMTARLERWAAERPNQLFVAQRGADGAWRKITYADMLRRVRSVAQYLLGLGLSVERPIAILSENDLEHLQLILGAMWAGIPTASLSPGNSLLSTDFAKLRHVFSVLTPGMIFASNAKQYGAAIESLAAADAHIVLTHGTLPGPSHGRPSIQFEEFLNVSGGAEADAAHDAVNADTIARFVFTSGSTKLPKAVITTQRMLCSNQQMLLQCLKCLGEQPPILVDWLPWNHTFGGSHNIGIVLYNGGTLYIDEGKPTPHLFGETLKNLREIAPTVYFNVPKAWEDLSFALEADASLREKFFSRVNLFFYAGAGLSQAVWDRLDAIAERTIGERIRMITGLGMTETAPSSLFTTGPEVKAGYVGLPAPGCETKLTPMGQKLEGRFRGPHVMPGYWRAAEQTREVFDQEGFYCTGDALKLVDPQQPDRGLFFDGRVTEDFKLSTGNFVSVGPLVRRVIAAGAPYVLDAVVSGINRNDIGLLIFPRVDTCRLLAGVGSEASLSDIVDAPPVRDFFQRLVDDLAGEGTGSSNRIARARLLREPPSFEKNEITDKGSINQRAVLTQRAALVDAMYEGEDLDVLFPQSKR